MWAMGLDGIPATDQFQNVLDRIAADVSRIFLFAIPLCPGAFPVAPSSFHSRREITHRRLPGVTLAAF
jgi:hypothetical protein